MSIVCNLSVAYMLIMLPRKIYIEKPFIYEYIPLSYNHLGSINRYYPHLYQLVT
jgi:hypothetical protein